MSDDPFKLSQCISRALGLDFDALPYDGEGITKKAIFEQAALSCGREQHDIYYRAEYEGACLARSLVGLDALTPAQVILDLIHRAQAGVDIVATLKSDDFLIPFREAMTAYENLIDHTMKVDKANRDVIDGMEANLNALREVERAFCTPLEKSPLE